MESAKAPVVNVWSVRREQLAARATSSAAPPSSSAPISPPPSLNPPPPSRPRPPPAVARVVPPVSDKESWPEVAASLGKDANGKEKEGERGKESKPKKAEKAKKWVPIPAEELQAAADALKPSSSSQRSKGQTRDTSRDRSSTRKNLGYNQQPGNRGPSSQAASTSHSRIQSRSGSAQSSPRGVGRRRLPDRDSNSNAASPKVNGVHTLGGAEDGKERSLRPTHPPPSERSSKSGSPHPARDPYNASFPLHQQPEYFPPLPPPHLYQQQYLHPHYGGVYSPGVPYSLSPIHGHPLLPPLLGPPYDSSPAGEGSADHLSAPDNHQNAAAGSSRSQVNGKICASGEGNGHKLGSVQFGSIDLTTWDETGAGNEAISNADDSGRKFLIGLAPEELTSVTRAVKNMGLSGSTGATTTKAGRKSRRSSFAVPPVPEDHDDAAEAKGKWEFGTTATQLESAPSTRSVDLLGRLDVVVEDGARLSPLSMTLSVSPGSQLPLGLSAGRSAAVSPGPPGLSLQPQHPPGLAMPQAERRMDTASPSLSGTSGSGTLETGDAGGHGTVRTTQNAPPVNDADFEVRDYGYGFGRVSGTGRAVELVREEMIAREREREWERSRQQAYAQGLGQPQQQGPGVVGRDGGRNERMQRPYETGGRERDRDGRGTRRGGGRGGNVGGGGGAVPPNRNMRRSNTPQTGPSGPHGPPQSLPPHFNPPHAHAPPLHMPFMPPPPGMPHPLHAPPGLLPHEGGLPSPSAYYGVMRAGYMGAGPPPSGMVSYLAPLPAPPLPPHLLPLPVSNSPSAISPSISLGSGPTVQPPVPVPMTMIPFPLDATRYYLLGQLEYYLSPENMAQDFFLRQRMDSRGWIPIALIASFNRVRRLTPDVNLVREVLFLSSMLQVRDQWVRMGGWERYVLPDAAESLVTEDKGEEVNHDGMLGVMVGLPPSIMMGEGVGGEGGGIPPMYGVRDGGGVGGLHFHGGDDGPGYESMPMPEHHYSSGDDVNGAFMQREVKGEIQRDARDEGEEEEEEDDVVFVMGRETP